MAKIHELITPDNWCKGALGIRSDGVVTGSKSDDCCKRCLLGWICYVYGHRTQAILFKARNAIGGTPVSMFNDAKGFEAVKKLCVELDI